MAEFVMVETRFPFLSITRMDPAEALPQVPSGDGKLPTSTNPLRRTFNAVESPSGAVPPKNWKTGAVGGNVDDGGPGTLELRTAVEIRNQNIAGIDRPARRKTGWHEGDPVWVYISVRRNGGNGSDLRRQKVIVVS